jgi:trans-aconitate methyltransferase
MNKNAEKWRQYYEKALSKKHSPRTEFAVKINKSDCNIAVDCGCGTGSDIDYLIKHGYRVHGFDVNSESVSICRNRFDNHPLVSLSKASFEDYNYPTCGVVIANSSLYFSNPQSFDHTWHKLSSSLVDGGVFAGDFMGVNDSWASNYQSPTAPLSKQHVLELFNGFEVIRIHERDELGKTTLGKMKHWHTFSLVAVKQN